MPSSQDARPNGDQVTITPLPSSTSAPDLMSFAQLAAYLQKTRPTIYTFMSKHGLPGRRIGDRWMFSKAEVDAWISSRPGVNLPSAN